MRNNSRDKIVRLVVAIFIAAFGFIVYPKEAIKTNQLEDNPDDCPYYITLQSVLANYAQLSYDRANLDFIKSRLSKFEFDVASKSGPHKILSEYRNRYFVGLNHLGVASVSEVSDNNRLLLLAHKTFPVIDQFYLDHRVSCVTPLYEWSSDHQRRILKYNLGGLYYGMIHDPFARIQFAVDSGVHIGVFSGFFVNNQTTTLGTQFMTGVPLLTALYVLPRYGFVKLGNYQGLVPWCAFWSGSLTNPDIRKILDIAGIDIFTVSTTDINKRIQKNDYHGIPGVELLKSVVSNRVDADFVTYRNTQSYGSAYLANRIKYVPADAVSLQEGRIKRYFARPVKHYPEQFNQATGYLYRELMNLKSLHDIILEAQQPVDASTTSVEQVDAGTVRIYGMMGPRAFFTSNCKRSNCEFVVNLAKAQGWHAIVNGHHEPISRVNFAFMGVKVPRGLSTIWFIYEPIVGLVSYLLGQITIILLLLLATRDRRKSSAVR